MRSMTEGVAVLTQEVRRQKSESKLPHRSVFWHLISDFWCSHPLRLASPATSPLQGEENLGEIL
jgi:hypothetical protein